MQHCRAVGLMVDAGIVAGGDEIKAHLLGGLTDEAKLGGGVAEDAGVGSAPGLVFPAEGQDDILLKLPVAFADVQADAQLFGHHLGLLDRRLVRGGKFEDDALDFISLLAQQVDGDRRIHPAADRNQYPLSGHGRPPGRAARRPVGWGRCRCGGSSRPAPA